MDEKKENIIEEGVAEIDFETLVEMHNLGVSIYDDIDSLDEGVIENIKKQFTNIAELKNQWKKFSDSFVRHEWIFRYITPKQEVMIDKYYHMLTDEDTTYGNYKRAFKFFCQFIGIPSNKCILENIVVQKNKKDTERTKLSVKYSKGLAKVHIPDDVMLIHVSPAAGITQLIPSFRSKVKGKYMYPSKRVFFTVAHEIKKNQAGLEGQKLSSYKTKQHFDTAYIDPTYSLFKDGSVYIETDQPIPVVPNNDRLGIKKFFKECNDIQSVSEEFEVAYESDLLARASVLEAIETVDESNFTDVDLSLVSEGIDKLFKQSFRSNWNVADTSSKLKRFESNSISEDEFDELKVLIKTLRTTEDYKDYKPAFNKFCKFCHIVSDGTIITRIVLKSGSVRDKNYLYVEYSYNNKKITLNEEDKLYHVSKVDGIKELKPFFRGKSEKGYLYDKPRIYMSLYEKLPKIMADYKSGSMYYYKVEVPISQVYVDPLLRSSSQGAVYVNTTKPIKVTQIKK